MKRIFLQFPDFKDKAVTLSYDDGVIYDRRLMEILDKNGLKCTFNLNSGAFSKDGAWRMTKQQALDLYKNSGHEVAIHGERHLNLTEVPIATANADVLNDRITLEEMFGTVITGMAYAYGAVNDAVVDVLKKCGVQYARTVNTTERFDLPTDWLRLPTTCHHNNPKLMQLAHDFIEDTACVYYCQGVRAPRLFYLWGHSYEFHDDDNWNVIEEFAAYIGHRDDVWYATNIEIYRYVQAYDALQFDVVGKRVYNPSALDVYLNYYGKKVLVKAGETCALH